jgi:hypothetical protein
MLRERGVALTLIDYPRMARMEEGRTVFAYANNHYQNHSPSALARFLEIRRGVRR